MKTRTRTVLIKKLSDTGRARVVYHDADGFAEMAKYDGVVECPIRTTDGQLMSRRLIKFCRDDLIYDVSVRLLEELLEDILEREHKERLSGLLPDRRVFPSNFQEKLSQEDADPAIAELAELVSNDRLDRQLQFICMKFVDNPGALTMASQHKYRAGMLKEMLEVREGMKKRAKKIARMRIVQERDNLQEGVWRLTKRVKELEEEVRVLESEVETLEAEKRESQPITARAAKWNS